MAFGIAGDLHCTRLILAGRYLGRGGTAIGCWLWAEVGKAQKGQQEGQATYLLCSTNSLCEVKRGREKEKEARKEESMLFIPSLLGALFPD